MANSILESYKGRISLSERLYAQQNDGRKMDNNRKIALATCLANTSKKMNEALSTSLGATQMADMGRFKKFCLDITTVTTPNLIVNDLFLVKPLESYSGYITYMEYSLGTKKGGVEEGEVIQNPFFYARMNENRANYTSSRVVEAFDSAAPTLAWYPVKKVTEQDVATDYRIGRTPRTVGDYVIKFFDNTGAEIDPTTYTVTIDAKGVVTGAPAAAVKVAYEYDNEIVPQDDIPVLKGRMAGIDVRAKARRIAVSYSQFASFIAKNDLNNSRSIA